MKRKFFIPRSGFTLVELVMVMVIIGLLAAIMIPKFSTQRDEAKIAVTKANLETLRTAVALYYAQEGGVWPSSPLLVDLMNSPSGKSYLDQIPQEGFVDSNTVEPGVGACGTAGGWCYDMPTGRVSVDLPDSNPLYADQIFSDY